MKIKFAALFILSGITNIYAQQELPYNALEHFEKGMSMMRKGVTSLKEYELVASEFKTALIYSPDYADALYNLGVIYTDIIELSGSYHAFYSAEYYLKKYLKTGPEDYDEVEMALLKLGVMRDSIERTGQLTASDYEKAIYEVKKTFLMDESDYAKACYTIALMYEKIFRIKKSDFGSYENAVQYYKKYLATSPENRLKIESSLEMLDRSYKEVKSEKRKAWNNDVDGLYFFYSYVPSDVHNASSMHGITASYLANFGFYISFRANPHFFRQKINLSNGKNGIDYAVAPGQDSDISSAEFAFGISKKIYRPVFITAGIGAGMNTLSRKYEVFTLDGIHYQWLYANGNRSFHLSPEVGLNLVFPPFVLSGNMHYRIPVTESGDITYRNNLSFSVGAGFAYIFRYRGIFVAYNLDIPTPSYLNFSTNSSLIGLTVGSLGGVYGSVRLNPLFISPGKRKNPDEKGNLFATAGVNIAAFLYLGGGIAWQKYENGKKIRFNPELGINLPFRRILLRGGINVPAFDFRYDNMYYSTGIGYIF
jgi:tetratricopeptide (TPR) repeat protein